MKIQDIITCMNEIAPPELACSWDVMNGLQLGSADTPASRVLVTLTITDQVVARAAREKVNCIISHHALFFALLSKIDNTTPTGRKIKQLLARDIAVFIAHTNLDAAAEGVNHWLARSEGLDPKTSEILEVTYTEPLYKLTVFVPKDHAEKVREAIAQVGAGHIGNYSHCTFNLEGQGTFKPLVGADPFIGQKGKLEKVDEIRIETIVPKFLLNKVIAAMIEAHPYEEVAYDVYSLANPGKPYGLGLVGDLKKPKVIKGKKVKRLAVCGGGAGQLIKRAHDMGAEAFIIGECSYHDELLAEELGMILVEKGHFETENLVVKPLAKLIQSKLPKAKVLTF